jgi:hypothetical protein
MSSTASSSLSLLTKRSAASAPYAAKTAPLVTKTDMAVKPEHGVQWRRLAKFHRETLHGRERRLAAIGGELKRVKECVGLPQSVVEEAESLVKKYFDLVAGLPAGGGGCGCLVDSRQGGRRA